MENNKKTILEKKATWLIRIGLTGLLVILFIEAFEESLTIGLITVFFFMFFAGLYLSDITSLN